MRLAHDQRQQSLFLHVFSPLPGCRFAYIIYIYGLIQQMRITTQVLHAQYKLAQWCSCAQHKCDRIVAPLESARFWRVRCAESGGCEGLVCETFLLIALNRSSRYMYQGHSDKSHSWLIITHRIRSVHQSPACHERVRAAELNVRFYVLGLRIKVFFIIFALHRLRFRYCGELALLRNVFTPRLCAAIIYIAQHDLCS